MEGWVLKTKLNFEEPSVRLFVIPTEWHRGRDEVSRALNRAHRDVNLMEIEVKLFATLRDYLPKGSDRFSCKLEMEGRARVKDILSKLKIPDEISKIILVNGIHGKNDQVLKGGDVVSIFPPVAGG